MKVILNLVTCLIIVASIDAQVTVFETDFQNGIPSNMLILDNDFNVPNANVSEFTSAWICVEDPNNPLDSVAASTSWFDPIDTADRWIITPPLPLGSFGNSISWNAKSQDASFPDDYYILASTTNTNISSFTDTIGYIQQEDFEWVERSVDLSDLGYDDETIYVAFVLRTYDGYKLYLDDILVAKEDDASIHEENLVNVSIYPNPAIEYFNIKSESIIDYTEIIDLSGKTILKTNESNIDVRFIEAGSYILKIYTNGIIVNKPLHIR
ncbi:choice-of-anchor J domain-containing protein [Crocinitomicaceae bacterium]|nr:choice-of-anchor J domain-containing protein [Crocinitomicaceae bacterium]